MIQTIAELLEEIRIHESRKLAEFGFVNHGTMIGDMYEGLTSNLIEKTLFLGLDLHVVSGKILFPSGALSNQIDCMLVVGMGTQLPFTKNWIYSIENVIAVIEVKKNLYFSDLQEAHNNLMSVTTPARERKPTINDSVKKSFRLMTRCEFPESNNLDDLSFANGMLAYFLAIDSLLPARIVFAYEGFKDESSLRNKFIEYLNQFFGNTETKNPKMTPQGLPNLIICRNNSLVKLNGMPYAAHLSKGVIDNPYVGTEEWNLVLASSSYNPMKFFIEILWYRLRQTFELPASIYGEDLQQEPINPLLYAKGAEWNDGGGWFYQIENIKKEDLRANENSKEWEPYYIDEKIVSVIAILVNIGSVDLNEIEFLEFCAKEGIKIDDVIEKLYSFGIAYKNHDSQLQLLTDECKVIALPNGQIVVADDYDGKLTRWLEKNTGKF